MSNCELLCFDLNERRQNFCQKQFVNLFLEIVKIFEESYFDPFGNFNVKTL